MSRLSKRYNIRLSEEQRSSLDRVAEAEGLKPSSWLRRQIFLAERQLQEVGSGDGQSGNDRTGDERSEDGQSDRTLTPRSLTFKLQLTPTEKQKLDEVAEAMVVRPSTWLRCQIHRAWRQLNKQT